MTDVSSTCSSCGAGMEIDSSAGVMRCPYCRREALLPPSHAPAPAWPFGNQFGAGQVGAGQVSAGQVGSPRVTVTVNGRTATVSSGQTTRTIQTIPAAQAQRALAGVTVAVVVLLIAAGWFWYLQQPSAPVEVAVGVAARVESFEVTVRSVDCGKHSIASPDDPATAYDETQNVVEAKGTFCVIAISAKNVGTKTASYPTYDLEATNTTERVLDGNYAAEDYLNNGMHPLREPVDPGNIADQLLVYDVPTNTTLAYLQLSELSSDSTVRVKLG